MASLTARMAASDGANVTTIVIAPNSKIKRSSVALAFLRLRLGQARRLSGGRPARRFDDRGTGQRGAQSCPPRMVAVSQSCFGTSALVLV